MKPWLIKIKARIVGLVFGLSFVCAVLWHNFLFLLRLVVASRGSVGIISKKTILSFAADVKFLLKIICKIDVNADGIGLVNGGCILISKHQSFWETCVPIFLIDRLHYVCKEELLKIPIYGKYLKNGDMIPVKRSGGVSAMKEMLASMEKVLSKGGNVMFFPQGSRVPYDGSIAAKYHLGPLNLRHKHRVLLVAMNSGVFCGRGIFSPKFSGTIQMKIVKLSDACDEVSNIAPDHHSHDEVCQSLPTELKIAVENFIERQSLQVSLQARDRIFSS